MELEAISGAATVALASTVVFLLVAKTWLAVSRTLNRAPSFSDRILHEAAQRFRDEFDQLTRSQSTYLSAALAFVMIFVAAYILQAKELFVGYPAWQLYLQLAFLTLASLYALYRLSRIAMTRHQIKFVRDANMAIGHQLRQLSSGTTRVFHDVATTAGIVDHVIVGQHGLYAVNVVAQRPKQDGRATLSSNAVEFSTVQSTDNTTSVSVVRIAAKTHRLQKELRELLGHSIRVRSVLAIPGWEITDQTSDDHLLVNERTIAIVSAWKDNSDHLMNEDVTAILDELTARCANTISA